MKKGKCIKCGSVTVYTRVSGVTYCNSGLGVEIDTGGWSAKDSSVDTYLCTTCGYFENYITDHGVLAEVARNKDWQQVQ